MADEKSKAERIAAAGESIQKAGCSIMQSCLGLAAAVVILFVAWAMIFG